MVLLLFWLGIKLAMPPLYFIVLGFVLVWKMLENDINKRG